MRWTAARTHPDRSLRYRFRQAAAQWAGWVAVVTGAVLCVLGWYGVSGERFAERQVPYLASSTIPGAALIVAGAVLIGRAESGVAAARLEELYARLVTAPGAAAAAAAPGPIAASAGPPVAVPGGTLFHRPDCPLAEGKPGAEAVGSPEAARERGLSPCPVCEPDRPRLAGQAP